MSTPTPALQVLARGLPEALPPPLPRSDGVPHAPKRTPGLTPRETKLALANALRYLPAAWHAEMAPELAAELRDYGHIYMYRLRPTDADYEMRAHPIDDYPAQCRQAACMQLMIMNNLSLAVAQFPEELITYGGNGSVFSNWAQYLLTMQYLSQMTAEQTLVLCSGHPQGLFPSGPSAPRAVITNGMMIPNYSTPEEYNRGYALGVTQYGQMTAGSFCYIGPQGIVHGTTLTILNACRTYLGTEDGGGVVFVSSGLGGMSGAQPKAGVIVGVVSVTAEVDPAALEKRYAQGWVQEKIEGDLDALVARIAEARAAKEAVSIGFLGNAVAVWERLADEAERGNVLVDIGSDQTSLHNPFGGGYYPVQVSFEEGRELLASDPERFKQLVQESLCRHAAALNRIKAASPAFQAFDYGNAWLKQCSLAGADVLADTPSGFKWPTYFEGSTDRSTPGMEDSFALGFGPYRWVCTSGRPEDLACTDALAADVLRELLPQSPEPIAARLRDNLVWIEKAHENQLVVGSQARILYAHREGRVNIALAMNAAVADGRIAGPIVVSRDHHDVSGTDSPFRETSAVADGSKWCADMAVQNAIGDGFRGAHWVALHNGGGVGWGYVMNGGFGLVLDGSEEAAQRASSMLAWDVNNGCARRAWARNPNAQLAVRREMEMDPRLVVTLPAEADDALLEAALQG